ncbi:MAG: restriction endonuclease subunit S [Spirochaetaceae bacterium]|nr:restriction endonuclease subunit S [Spirochaetaceae bacterium]
MDNTAEEMRGKCSEITNVNGMTIVSGLHTIPCRPSKPFASGYLGYFMNSTAYHDQLMRLMQGTKVLSISKAALQDTNIYFPEKNEEQAKIATFFQRLDSLITLHQQELDKLKNIKKACLEKMFV